MPQRHAKAHVRLHRNSKYHVGEQLSFKSPRKRERKNDLLFLNMLIFSSYSAANFQRAFSYIPASVEGQNHGKTEVHISRCIIYIWYKQVYCASSYSGTSVAVNFRWTSLRCCGFFLVLAVEQAIQAAYEWYMNHWPIAQWKACV